MGTALLFFRILAIATTIIQAYPAGEETMNSRSRHHIPMPTSKASVQPLEKHVAASPNPTSASSASAQAARYAADAAGPPTTLSPNQIQNNKEEAQIAAEGQSLYRAGTSSTASVASASAAAATAAVDCNDGTWAPTLTNHNKAKTDQNLKKWWFGGEDTDNNTFTAKNFRTSFLTQTLAADFMPVGNEFYCTLESHQRNPADDCNSYNVHLGTSIGHTSHWAFMAAHAISNLYSFAESFQTALILAGVDNSFLTLDVATVFTKPAHNPHLLLREILIGFSTLFIAVFSFIPIVGEIVAAGGTLAYDLIGYAGGLAAAAIGNGAGFFATALAGATTLDAKAAAYGAFMASVFNNTASGIDSLVQALMSGNNLAFSGGTPLLFDVIAGGGWANPSVVQHPAVSETALTSVLQKDLLQRGINFIWGQSKIYVTFANLNDDAAGTKCKADLNGWQASKTCLDGGVYYLYRFNEAGNEDGNLDYPWGADQMAGPQWNLNPRFVTHSSATAYRSQNNGIGGFAYDYTKQPTNLPSIFEAVGRSGSLEYLNALEGVWNLSVCDMGTHSDWNADFTQTPIRTTNQDGLKFIFPCCCGPKCSQTADFVRSAQMENFQTIYNTCKQQLALCDAWPPGVTVIDFGGAGTITKETPSGNVCVFNSV